VLGMMKSIFSIDNIESFVTYVEWRKDLVEDITTTRADRARLAALKGDG
jgi:hypothetical protein